MRMEHWLYSVPLRLRSLFRRRQVEQDLDDELQFHLDRKTEEFLAKGLTQQQSRRAALRSMEGLTQCREECREARHISAIENILQDLRYALRVLAKSRGFTAVAVLTLALAIGANAVVFGVMNGITLRLLNVPRAESLYGIEHGNEHSMYESYPDYVDLRDRNRSFEDLAAFDISMAALDNGRNPTRAWGYLVTGNYFDALGIQPYLGHFFHASDEHGPNSAPFLVLSYGYWHSHFNDDRGIIGRVIRVNRSPFTVVGVAPPEFHGTILFFSPAFFLPILNRKPIDGDVDWSARVHTTIFMTLGHLKPGVTTAQAVADLNSIGSWLEKTYPKAHGTTTFTLARPGLYGNYLGAPARAFLTGLMLMAGLILLAACANLGSLFAARAADRSREVALRLALGSSRSRILRTLFTEAILISLAGGALGLWGSVLLLRALSLWQPVPKFPINLPVSPDASVYAVALLLAVVSGILFGMVPVRQVLRVDPYQVVKAGSMAMPGRRITTRDLLLVVQIALCGVLVTSSLVAVRGLLRSEHTNFGFDSHNALLVNTDLKMTGYVGDAAAEMQKRMADAVSAIPGVESSGLIDWPPLYNGGARTALVFTDETVDLRPSNRADVAIGYSVSSGYLHAAGTRLVAGRGFTDHDDKSAPAVAVVNRQFVAKVFGPAGDAVGRYFKFQNGTRIQVIGIVEDGKYVALTEDSQPAMFLSILQSPSSETTIVLRSRRDPQELSAAVRRAIHELDPALPSYMETWDQALGMALFPSRVATAALGVLGAMGAMLSITGIFGMAAYSVSRRLRELGIRLAIGARRQEILEAALGRAVKLLAWGSAAGVALGLLSARVLAAVVYHATPRDPLVLVGVILAMLLLGLAATWIPARRALSLDPVILLREE